MRAMQAFPQARELREPLPYACRHSSRLTYVKHIRSQRPVNLTLVTFSGTYVGSSSQSVIGLGPGVFDEVLQGIDVGHRGAIGSLFRRNTHEDAAHGYLHLLARQRVWNRAHLKDS